MLCVHTCMHTHIHTHLLIYLQQRKEKEKEITCYQRLKVVSGMCQGSKVGLKLTFFCLFLARVKN